MCVLCLQDFDFQLPIKPSQEQKRKRVLKVKTLLNLASQLTVIDDVCEGKLGELKEEQYRLSREF